MSLCDARISVEFDVESVGISAEADAKGAEMGVGVGAEGTEMTGVSEMAKGSKMARAA